MPWLASSRRQTLATRVPETPSGVRRAARNVCVVRPWQTAKGRFRSRTLATPARVVICAKTTGELVPAERGRLSPAVRNEMHASSASTCSLRVNAVRNPIGRHFLPAVRCACLPSLSLRNAVRTRCRQTDRQTGSRSGRNPSAVQVRHPPWRCGPSEEASVCGSVCPVCGWRCGMWEQ